MVIYSVRVGRLVVTTAQDMAKTLHRYGEIKLEGGICHTRAASPTFVAHCFDASCPSFLSSVAVLVALKSTRYTSELLVMQICGGRYT